MHWDLSAIFAALGFLTTIFVAVFVYGKLTQKVENIDERSRKNERRLDAHDDCLDKHAMQIAELKAWRDGYNAAAAARTAV